MPARVLVLPNRLTALREPRQAATWADEVQLAYARAYATAPSAQKCDAVRGATNAQAVLEVHFDRTEPAVIREPGRTVVPLRLWKQFATARGVGVPNG
jgi:hypothetical protein